MKRRVVYGLLLIALLFAPVDTVNISLLRPVQVIALSRQDGLTVIQTDTEDRGVGVTTAQALQNLKDTTGGILYLDTARYLLFTEEAQTVAEELRGLLKNSTRVCKIEEVPQMKSVAEYLRPQRDLPRLDRWKTGDSLPALAVFEDRMIFLKKVENKA